jgi:hypothetical protein
MSIFTQKTFRKHLNEDTQKGQQLSGFVKFCDISASPKAP